MSKKKIEKWGSIDSIVNRSSTISKVLNKKNKNRVRKAGSIIFLKASHTDSMSQ